MNNLNLNQIKSITEVTDRLSAMMSVNGNRRLTGINRGVVTVSTKNGSEKCKLESILNEFESYLFDTGCVSGVYYSFSNVDSDHMFQDFASLMVKYSSYSR